MGWLPPPSTTAEEHHRRRWKPPSPDWHEVDFERCSYLVVDEIVGGSTGLVLSSWPDVDEQGRLRFDGTPKMLGTDREALQSFLDEHRLPATLAQRPVRIGDAFAVRVIADALVDVSDELSAPRRLEPLLQPAAWIEPPVYDVTAQAREAAKTAFYAAVTPILTPSEAAELANLTVETVG
jgi:hypothetical protein